MLLVLAARQHRLRPHAIAGPAARRRRPAAGVGGAGDAPRGRGIRRVQRAPGRGRSGRGALARRRHPRACPFPRRPGGAARARCCSPSTRARSPPRWRAPQAQLAAARTQAEPGHAAKLARAEKLLPMQAVSQQEVDQLRAAARNAPGRLQRRRGRARRGAAEPRATPASRAPIAGRVSRTNVTAGNLVSVSEPVLTTIVSTDRVYAYFDASEAAFLQVRRRRRRNRAGARRRCRWACPTRTAFRTPARIDFVDNRLNPATGSIRSARGVRQQGRPLHAGPVGARQASAPAAATRRRWCPTAPSAPTRPARSCWWSAPTTWSSRARSSPAR